MKGLVTQSNCQRVATVTRITSAGKMVDLCKQCDAKFGSIVGKVYNKIVADRIDMGVFK